MKVVIDASALERLLGGDTELEVQLRTGVANQFADKFLKSLVNSQLIKTTGDQIEHIIRNEVLSGPQFRKVLAQKYQKVIEEAVTLALASLVHQEVRNVIDSGYYETMIKEFVHRESSRITHEWTGKNIEDRISAAADEKIKIRLGLK